MMNACDVIAVNCQCFINMKAEAHDRAYLLMTERYAHLIF